MFRFLREKMREGYHIAVHRYEGRIIYCLSKWDERGRSIRQWVGDCMGIDPGKLEPVFGCFDHRKGVVFDGKGGVYPPTMGHYRHR